MLEQLLECATVRQLFTLFQEDIINLLSLPEITAKPALLKYIDLDSSFDDSDSEKELFYNASAEIDGTQSVDNNSFREILDSEIDELFGSQGFVDVQFE